MEKLNLDDIEAGWQQDMALNNPEVPESTL